jgi:hypothetical protein
MAIVYTASTRQIEMYLNDATTAEVTRTVPLADVVQNTDRFSLGQEWDGATPSGFFAGQLDEVRIWTTSRSTTQIADNLYREVAMGSTGLAAYYKMTNNAGTSVTDNTGNSRTGTLVNGTAWQSSTVTKNSNGTVSADQNIDEGESPADITISDPPYANLLWQSSPDNSNWSDISGATGTTLSSAQTGILSATTYYRARLDNGYGSFDFSDVVTVDVQQSTLAVSWLSFEALSSGSGIELRWQTAQELHASHFEMEHSVNNRDWRYLSPVAAAGNSNSVQSYRFLHTNPGTGSNFYRIKEVDQDGKVSYSKTVKAVWGEANGRLLLYPNPVNNGRINLLLKREGMVRIFNSQGVLVLQQQHSAGLKNISVSQLARGVYLLQAEGKSLQLLIQ